MIRDTDKGMHRRFWELIPWHVNGRIGEADRRRLDSHLEACAGCRAEWQAQRRIHGAMTDEPSVEYIPSASLKVLQDRLDRITSPAADHTPPGAAPAARTARQGAPWQAVMAACFAVMAAALLLLAGALWGSGRGRDAPAGYHTVTDPARHPPDEVVRAVFASSMTLAELQRTLDAAQLRIAGGPTEAGVYSLASAGSLPVGQSLARLRGHTGVRFAEATGPAAAGHAP